VTRRRATRVLFALAMAAIATVIFRDAPARWLVVADPPAKVDAAVVLAGDPDYERTLTAARLLASGDARLLVLTGGEPGPGDSAASLRERAVAAGVDPSRIRLEAASTSTRESLLAVRDILDREGVRTVVLVTSPYHQRRAWLAARRAWPGRTIHNHPASPSSWAPEAWWRRSTARRAVVSEYGKLLYYGLRGWLA
jgi:uncharacterized SAM-binding protein YcdF (DUF218 family)